LFDRFFLKIGVFYWEWDKTADLAPVALARILSPGYIPQTVGSVATQIRNARRHSCFNKEPHLYDGFSVHAIENYV